MKKKILISLFLLSSILTINAQTWTDILRIGPFNTPVPSYFYIDTKIPFNDQPAPQIQITGYNYSKDNKTVKLTLSWYEYYDRFYWAQYKSDLGYYNPSRIRLGTYDDAGTLRVRIEIANDGTYWSSYFISATDIRGASSYYEGWSFNTGTMPSETGNIITVSEYAGIVYSNTGNIGIHTTTPGYPLDVTGDINFTGNLRNNGQPIFTYYNNNIGIKTSTPEYPLDVVGIIRAHKVKINQLKTADFVFASDYKLPTLNEVESFIKTHKHLEGIASSGEMEKDGVEIGDLQISMLQKIEELTLYTIEQNNKIEDQEKQNTCLKTQLENQQKINAELQQKLSQQGNDLNEMKAEIAQLKKLISK